MTLLGVASDTRIQVARTVVLPMVSSWAVIPPCGCRSGPGREQSTKAELQSSPGTPGLLTWIPGQQAPGRDVARGPQSSPQQKHLFSVSQVENRACQGSLAPGLCSLMWRWEPVTSAAEGVLDPPEEGGGPEGPGPQIVTRSRWLGGRACSQLRTRVLHKGGLE